jgi:hypothetical protein
MAATAKNRSPVSSPAPLEYPHFASEEEAREFWSSHDTSPYWHLMEDVTDAPPPGMIERPAGAKSQARKRPRPGEIAEITVRVSAQLADVLKGFAHQRNLSLDALLAEWLGDRIKEERRRLHGDLDLPEDAERPFQ